MFRYSRMVCWQARTRSATSGAPRCSSGNTIRRVEGASPTTFSTSAQYSGWEVNWSQAMTAQRWASTDALGSSTRGVRTTTGALTGSP